MKLGLCLLSAIILSSNGRKKQQPRETVHLEPIYTLSQPSEDEESSCRIDKEAGCSKCAQTCVWSVPNHDGLSYSLTELCDREFDSKLQNPLGAILKISPCGTLKCGGQQQAKGCITVPGIKPTVTGKTVNLKLLVDGLPSHGFQLVLDEGYTCEVTGKPRQTIVTFPCDAGVRLESSADSMKAVKAYEGEKKEICHYHVVFPSTELGCPLYHFASLSDSSSPVRIHAVSGCIDSSPLRTTSNCLSNGKQTIMIHGVGFGTLCPLSHSSASSVESSVNQRTQLRTDNEQCTKHIRSHYCVLVGSASACTQLTMVDAFGLTCVLDSCADDRCTDLDLKIVESNGKDCSQERIVAEIANAVSFKKTVNFREKFNQFSSYGVGGLRKEIDELYRRAFTSRGLSEEMLTQLGITHIKGILLHGPPGTGKTLLARTIAKILGSTQVQLINGPEIISKYLGESERNLRGYFDSAHESYRKHGDASDLYVIIIDEIDAICKPRGKSDQSAAGVAYDSLVNQLLTLMDGLSEVSNMLVIGMTNRKELMDPALLRPGRFEVQIELRLPDEDGRLEIFEIHTRSMRESGLLSSDISLVELAANTSGYSGAEIAGCVRAASSYALERHSSNTDDVSTKSFIVTSHDFHRALEAIPPANTYSESVISSHFLPPVFFHLGAEHERVITSLLDIARSLLHISPSYSRMQSVLLYGPRGTGKTSLAAQVAVIGRFKLVKMITASSIVGLPDIQKVDFIKQAFTDAMKVQSSLIVLDDLHRLLEYVCIGTQVSVSHSMMHVVSTMLLTPPPTTSSVLVIGTITADDLHSLTEQPTGLGLYDLFSWHYMVPPMDSSAVSEFLNMKHVLRKDDGGRLVPPRYLDSIPIKVLIQSLECALSHDLVSPTSPLYIDQKQFNECLLALTSLKKENVTKAAYAE